jgi:alanyl-tRNA synthetase
MHLLMTERLYYDDPYKREFDATVASVQPYGATDPHAGRHAVRLDRTAFYPTTGGQPFDAGTLGASRVVDVIDDEGGEVVHVVEGPAPVIGAAIRGVVEWPRRFDHMQQHTGQHVLSAAFVRLSGVKTVSFHLGAEVSTIDLAREVTVKEIAAAEDEANRIVWDDRPVAIRYASAEEAAALPLRKEPTRTGTLRLIDVEGFDLSACGGTHVNRTGAIGLIAVTAWERFKGGQRLEFVCGGRVLTRFRLLRDVTAAAVRSLSVLPGDVASGIERLQSDLKEQKRRLADAHTALARHEARELSDTAEPLPWGRLVLRALDADAGRLKSLASAITSHAGFLAVLLSTASPNVIVVARSADVAIPCHDIVSALAQRFAGRGGGKPDLAQGGGLNAPVEELLAEARRVITIESTTRKPRE